MDSLLAIASQSLAAGFVLFAIVHFAARGLNRQHWVLAQFGLIAIAGGILSIQALLPVKVLNLFVLFALTAMAAKGAFDFSKQKIKNSGFTIEANDDRRQFGFLLGAVVLGVLFVLTELIWASFPYYRYDQWNYHLPIGKLIDEMGQLPFPISDDHVYFSGYYEYFLILARVFSKNDFVVQGITNVFTPLVYLSGFYGAFKILLQDFSQDLKTKNLRLLSAALAIGSYFATPHREALVSAKPEAHLIILAFLATVFALQSLSDKRSSFAAAAFGFCLAFPVGLKVTWLHAAGALGLTTLMFWIYLKLPLKKRILGAFFGGMVGLVLASPTLIKNQLIFGNPIHPVQIGFHSTRWSDFMALHWSRDNQPAKDLASYFWILTKLPGAWIERVAVLFLMCASLVFVKREELKRLIHNEIFKRQFWYFIICVAIFTLVWPLAGDPQVQGRYALAGIGFACPLVAWIIFCVTNSSPAVASLCLLIPLFLSGHIEVRAKEIVKAIKHVSVLGFYEKMGSPYTVGLQANEVNQDRKLRGITDPRQATVLLDTPYRYLFDSVVFRASYYDYEYEKTQFFKQNNTQCEPTFLKFLKVEYLVVSPESIVEFKTTFKRYFEASDKMGNQEVYHMSPENLNKLAALDPLCESTLK